MKQSRRGLVAFCAGTLALTAAVVAAVGPARAESAEYVWPPAIRSGQPPSAGWYAPLPLLNRVPASIDVRLPCGLSRPLRRVAPATVLSTARSPWASEALNVTKEGKTLHVRVGASEIAAVPWPDSCPLHIEVAGGEVRLPSGETKLRTGTLEDMPNVTGLFTNLDLRSGEPPTAVIRTRTYATSWTTRQFLAAGLAVALASLTLFLLAFRGQPIRTLQSVRRWPRAAWEARDATDAVVVGALVVWWIVAPSSPDDSWFWGEHWAFDDIGEFSLYYRVWGLSVPLGYWIEWPRHWVIGSTSDLVFMRLPGLFAVLLMWAVCRWCMRSVAPGPRASVVRWTLAGAFLVGATGWSMTLRMEPYVALLAVVTAGAMIRFSQAPGPGPLALAVPAVALALTAHTTGIVALAPLVASARPLITWLREGGRLVALALGGLTLAGLALTLVLFTLDADVASRLEDSRAWREIGSHDFPWWREYVRYTIFDLIGGGTTTRRLSLMLLLLTVVVYLTRVRPDRTRVSALPARTVLVALLLLAFVPSKWPWHFGAFVGIGALGVTAEVARLARERPQPGRLDIRSIAATAVLPAVVLVDWAYASPLPNATWKDALGTYTWLAVLALVVMVAAVDRARRKRQKLPGDDRLSAITGWAIVLVSFLAVGVTVANLAIDATISSWSPTQQNLAALVGDETCGFASELRGDGDLTGRIADPDSPTLAVPPLTTYLPCARTPALAGGVVEIPSLALLNSGWWPLDKTDSPFAAVLDLYTLQEIARGPESTRVFSVDRRIPAYARADALRR